MNFKTPFTDAITPNIGTDDGSHASVENGADILQGQKGTPGIMPEVTFVDIPEGPSVGASGLDAAAGVLGSQTKKTSPDLCD